MSEVKALVKISKYAGERFDLVQAGGGNSSVKFDSGEMIIKASGFLLSDVNENSGYSKVYTQKIAQIVKNTSIINEQDKRKRESLTSTLVKEATIDKINRPSIETLLHSFLYKYTLHTHPIAVNMIVIRKDWKDILKSIFKDNDIALVDYKTPGIELALELDGELSHFDTVPNIIFLQNHGLIITSTHKNEIYDKTEYVLERIENYLKIDLDQYKTTNKITYLLNTVQKNSNIAYLSEDMFLNEQLTKNKEIYLSTPFCPDSLVYCGVSSVVINDIFDVKSIEQYKSKYHELPKVIIFENKLYFIAANVKKVKEMEEVFKFHIMVLVQSNQDINYLAMDELAYLSNWEAENFRRKI